MRVSIKFMLVIAISVSQLLATLGQTHWKLVSGVGFAMITQVSGKQDGGADGSSFGENGPAERTAVAADPAAS